MRPQPVLELDEELGIEGDAAVRRDVDLGHPPANPIGIELRVPGRIERVREVDAPAIAADLDHLRSAIEGARFIAGMGLAPNDATDRDRAAEPRLEWVRYVVLSQLAGSPAAHIKKTVVERQIDVGDQRRNGLEAL